jgi:hypothetical protein
MTTKYYVGNVEVISKSDSNLVTMRRSLGTVIQRIRSNGTVELDYLHKDHLGSIDTISDVNGDIKQKLYFDVLRVLSLVASLQMVLKQVRWRSYLMLNSLIIV